MKAEKKNDGDEQQNDDQEKSFVGETGHKIIIEQWILIEGDVDGLGNSFINIDNS